MKRYVITTLVPDVNINKNFLTSLEFYCEKNNADLIFIPTNVFQLNEDQILDNRILKTSKHLNRHLLVSVLPIKPDMIDPLSGLDRLSDSSKSVIYASTKQRLKSVPSPSERLPRVLMTTGAVTNANVANTKKSIISNKDHILGAIIVDIETKSIYHYRQVQADRDGSFVDLGKKYNGNQITEMKVNALIPGDYHCGSTDPQVRSILLKVINKYNPKNLILHDFFDGLSINHHIQNNVLARAKMGKLNSLKAELKFASNELKFLEEKCQNVYIVKSNHDEFIDKYIDEGIYVTDERNHIIGLELALAKANGNDPLEYGLKKYNTFDNIHFLQLDESLKLTNKKIECGAHGHKGANGSRGNATNLERCYGNIVFGHTHSPHILRGAWVVGTSSHLRLSYNTGPSSWMQTFCLIYENGSRQLFNVIDGKCII